MQKHRRFTKIKYNAKKGYVFISCQQGKYYQDEVSLKCSEPPRPEFIKALAAFDRHVMIMCELPEDYLKRITTKSVSLNYGGPNETMGATITASMELYDSYAPLNLNTPNKPVEMYDENAAENPMAVLSEECINSIDNLIDEAGKYLDGERAQGKLFKDNGEPAAQKQGKNEVHK